MRMQLFVERLASAQQARSSIDKYGVHMVVANILDRRKEQVQLVEASGSFTSAKVITVQRTSDQPFIEKQLVDAVVAQHGAYWKR